MLRMEIRHSVSTGYNIPLQYFIHWFDATNFCEQPNDVIFNRDTSLFDSFYCNSIT